MIQQIAPHPRNQCVNLHKTQSLKLINTSANEAVAPPLFLSPKTTDCPRQNQYNLCFNLLQQYNQATHNATQKQTPSSIA